MPWQPSSVIRVVVGAVCGIILPRDGEPHGLPGDVLDVQPGLEEQREVDDAEDQHQQDRQGQGKFQHGL